MSDARREQDDEPLTQLDVDIDTRNLDSLIEGDVSTLPGTDAPHTDPDGADGEPQTMEPPRVLGVPRLRARAHTIMGVAPPSSGASSTAKGPPTTQSEPGATPRRLTDNDDEQTTMVGKLLAEAHAEVAKRLKAEPKEEDLYADETATTVGDAEKLLATANAAVEGDEVDEPTESRSVKDALMEDVTSKRDAINIDSALARAAELRAEAEARKKRAMKKRTMHGLGDGPLKLPERPKSDDDVPTFENKLPDTGEHPASSRQSDKLVVPTPMPADGEMETLSGGAPQPAPMRSIHTEPETIQVPVPSTPRDRLVTTPANASTLLAGHAPPPVSPPEAFQETLNLPPGASPYTQPMPYAPTVRMDDPNGVDPLRATMQSPPGAPGPLPAPSPQLAMSPPGGVPHYHSTPMPVAAPQYSMQGHPHSGPGAFARTAVATRSEPLEIPKKKSRAGLVFFFFLLLGLGGVGFWQRATLRAIYIAYRYPPPPAQPSAAPSAAVPPASLATGPNTPPPVATDAPTPHGSSSAAPHGSASAAPHASASAAPSASASASASGKTQAKKPPPWKPAPPKPKPTSGTAPKPLPVPKPAPADDTRGF